MKPNQRRPRSRGNGKRHSGRNQSFESSGPDGKIRGTAQQVYDKYQALGRDAVSSGDRVAAEGFFQHAEHYFRILSVESRANGAARPEGQDGRAEGEAVEVQISDGDENVSAPDQQQDQQQDQPAA
ncbi:MAG: DUF4167 domain-containing protein [Rhodospirillales bacterium]